MAAGSVEPKLTSILLGFALGHGDAKAQGALVVLGVDASRSKVVAEDQ